VINEYKASQETLLEKLHDSITSTYLTFQTSATEEDIQRLFTNRQFREEVISRMRNASVHRVKSADPEVWPRYTMRFRDCQRLSKDIKQVKDLLEAGSEALGNDSHRMRETDISPKGDTVLEFANVATKLHPPLRFRVLSHVLAEFSPLFAQMFAADSSRHDIPPDMISELPQSSYKQTLKDGSEVTVYRMPQLELNSNGALTTLLHAAHLHNSKVPMKLAFEEFVSIAEVCLRYRCTSPVEWAVESRWLSQWQDAIGNELLEDHLLFISYVFNLGDIFLKTTKSVILNISDDDNLQSKVLWPKEIRDKISAVRMAKLAQIRDCCNNTIREYLRPSRADSGRTSSNGSLQLTSTPKCPRKSHECDAMNLGWLMLVFGELGVLPNAFKSGYYTGFDTVSTRSLKDLIHSLQLASSPPSLHSEVCDYAPAFRSAISDILHSISGLSLAEVHGKHEFPISSSDIPVPGVYEMLASTHRPSLVSLNHSSINSDDGDFGPKNERIYGQNDRNTRGSHDNDFRSSLSAESSASSEHYRVHSPVSPLATQPPIFGNSTRNISSEETQQILYPNPLRISSPGTNPHSAGIGANEKFSLESKLAPKEVLHIEDVKYLPQGRGRVVS
jgi:hypothetical protein